MSHDRHYLEAELRQLVRDDDQIFQFLQASSLDGIWYWNLENPADEWMSDRFWQVLGQDPDTRAHKAEEWQGLIHPDDLAPALQAFHDHCADPTTPYDQVVRYKHPHGHWVWVRCRGLAIRDNDGKPVRMLGAHNDITSLKAAEARLQEQARALEAQNRSLQEFAFAASHDLQEPLRKLTTFSEILAEDLGDDLSDDARYDLGVITDAAARMREMIEALLSLSRASSDTLRFDAVPLGPVVERAVETMRDAIDEVGGSIVVEPLPALRTDARWLERLFANLIGNAVKYRSDKDLSIRVSWHADRDAVGVHDNGIGIDPDQHLAIFSAFKRLHSRAEIPGAGLGLALCQRVIERHQGEIWVESKPGEGASFYCSIGPEATAQG